MGGWNLFVYLMFPFPLVSLLLLAIPLPYRIKLFTMNSLSSLLFKKILFIFNFYQLSVLINIYMLSISIHSLVNIHQKIQQQLILSSSLELKGLKWRYERNFWISFFSLFCWILLYYFYYLIKNYEKIKKLIDNKNKSE